ncbi:MAG: type 1 glutamine amidotransferase [Thaumarchaeota archaeon]|nr:MAG: type 1 glutamine amidotransferase [Nitrososphaerota archaeon]TLY15291.1 MAG: type 1 glutamine amidotransferase [Nitrososphaerota archaeon]
MSLSGKRVAVLAENLFEDLELWYPVIRMREAGATVVVVGSGSSEVYRGKHGLEVKVDTSAEKVEATAFDAVIVPGGYCPDYLRRYPSVLKFVRDAHDRGEVIGAICHAPWVLVSAGLLKGRTVTCFRSIKDDVVNAGARYVDREVVRDGNIITSRFPDDLPAFCREIITALEEMKVAPLKGRAR